jgi:nicotinamidase-related amidase
MTSPSAFRKLELCSARAGQLILIDAQERLCKVMPPDCLEQALHNMGRLAQTAQTLEIPIIVTEQYPKGLGDTRLEVAAHLPEGLLRVTKTSFSCCSADGFETQLHKREERPQVVLAGIEAHICILQTAAGLQHWGYQVFVVADATCSRSPEYKHNALARLQEGGVNVTNTESVAFEWVGDAGHPRFKEIARMFK